jgi:hypothetical protein
LAVTQPSGSGKANQYFLCGFNLDHGTDFSTLVDGVPINFPTHAHGQGYMDLNWVILELVDYVTFRKGLYYADVGDYSSAGAADFHLVKTLPEGLAKVETGQDDYYRGLLGWQAILRLQHPLSLGGLVPVVMGLAAAVGNGGVAWLLWGPGQEHTAIRLAYVHNRGDVVMSCAPVIAGVLITLSGRGVLDVAMALGVAVWMCCSMLRELLVAPKELLSPGTLSCWYASTGRISLWTEPSV